MNIFDKCFVKEKDLVTRDVAGEEIIVPIKGHVGDLEGVFTLNEVGALIWRLIDGRTTALELAEAVRKEYDVLLKSKGFSWWELKEKGNYGPLAAAHVLARKGGKD